MGKDSAMKTILVTGATGDVGTEVIRELANRLDRYRVRMLIRDSAKNRSIAKMYQGSIEAVYGDVRNYGDVRAALEGADAVIHTAAIIPPLADEKPELARVTNVDGTKNVCRAMKETNGKGLVIFTSSISVYGDRVDNPEISCNDPLEPSLGDEYAATKLEAEKIITTSGLPWVIFRLTYITTPYKRLTAANTRLLFHMPLDTSIEILESDDTAYALVQALEAKSLYGRVHNLGGGAKCRTTFRDYLDRYFEIYGLGKKFLPEEAFARRNFHCGYYRDSAEAAKVLGYQRHTLEDHFNRVDRAINPLVKIAAFMFRPVARRLLLLFSEPYAVLKGKKAHLKERFFG